MGRPKEEKESKKDSTRGEKKKPIVRVWSWVSQS
jgi:hypothetical protein